MTEDQIVRFLQLAKSFYKSKRDPFRLIKVNLQLLAHNQMYRNAVQNADFDYFFVAEILFDYKGLSQTGKSIKELETTILSAKSLREAIIEPRINSKSYTNIENIFALVDEWISEFCRGTSREIR